MNSTVTLRDYRDTLRERARVLRTRQSSVPIYLRHVCAQLGIGIRRVKAAKDGKSYLSWNRASAAGPTILLPEHGHPRWDRFCAAHEIGHYFLISEYNWLPNSGESYWETEKICDDFARSLLMPPQLFESRKFNSDDLLGIFYSTHEIAKNAIVPWNQVAIRKSELQPELAFFKVDIEDIENDYIVCSSSLPDSKARKSKIRKGSPAFEKIRNSIIEANFSKISGFYYLNTTEFKGNVLKCVFTEQGVESVGVVVRPDRSSFFLVSRSAKEMHEIL
jgi:Zn-dependent peptidase ImmA (M78 family)